STNGSDGLDTGRSAEAAFAGLAPSEVGRGRSIAGLRRRGVQGGSPRGVAEGVTPAVDFQEHISVRVDFLDDRGVRVGDERVATGQALHVAEVRGKVSALVTKALLPVGCVLHDARARSQT